ncbi:hypothetical protein RND71_003425 [Anisodus tanguticus]|uniref:Uncharacterized protein n=1 Tax=Anisodus tanguticus TaxID=243964 RepID=A0AAE1SUK5_9SOLA|nr:hypothetical protein RND71_003425 [Anisodus tanguticus]
MGEVEELRKHKEKTQVETPNAFSSLGNTEEEDQQEVELNNEENKDSEPSSMYTKQIFTIKQALRGTYEVLSKENKDMIEKKTQLINNWTITRRTSPSYLPKGSKAPILCKLNDQNKFQEDDVLRSQIHPLFYLKSTKGPKLRVTKRVFDHPNLAGSRVFHLSNPGLDLV